MQIIINIINKYKMRYHKMKILLIQIILKIKIEKKKMRKMIKIYKIIFKFRLNRSKLKNNKILNQKNKMIMIINKILRMIKNHKNQNFKIHLIQK